MIDSKHHVRIAGNLFRIDESAEGAGYIRQGETLRPPNAVQVQGETQAKFQMRPDTLVWSITDWSGGEGFRKFDPQNPNRHWRLTNVDAFHRPGILSPGPSETSAEDDLEAVLTDRIRMVGTDTRGVLWGISAVAGSTGVKIWKNLQDIQFDWVVSMNGGSTQPTIQDAVMVGDGLFFILERDTTNTGLYRFPTDTEATQVSWVANLADQDSAQRKMGAVGLNLYIAVAGRVYEVSATATEEETLIDDQIEILGSEIEAVDVVASRNRVFVVWSGQEETIIRQITPSTAAGTGFGEELVRFGGLDAQSAWVQGDFLFVSGLLQGESTVMYISLVDRTYGTLGKVQAEPSGVPSFIPRLFEGGSPQPSFLETHAYFGWEGDVNEGNTVNFSTPGEFEYEVPAEVDEVLIEVWGAGGGGGGSIYRWIDPNDDALMRSGPGGGGGQYARRVVSMGVDRTLEITVGAGGAGGTGTVSDNSSGDGIGGFGGDSLVTQNSGSFTIAVADGGDAGETNEGSDFNVFSIGESKPGGEGGDGLGGGGEDQFYRGGDGGDGYTNRFNEGNDGKISGGGGGGSGFTNTNGIAGGDGVSYQNMGSGSPQAGGGGEGSGGQGGFNADANDDEGAEGKPGGAPGAGGGGAAVWRLGSAAVFVADGGDGAAGLVRISWGTSVSAPDEEGETAIYVIDSVSGGLAQWAPALDTAGNRAYPFLYQDRVYYVASTSESNPTRVVTARRDELPVGISTATTPIWDFALQDRKVLTSFRIHTAPLPADWTVAVEYQLDENQSWLSAGSIQGSGVTGGTLLVSGSPKFRSLQVRTKFTYTGSGTAETPSLHGVEARATVALPIRIWRLSLDAFDSFGGGSQSERGATKASEIETAYLNGSVIELDDGYESAEAGVYTTHNVVVDSFQRIVSRSGEGNIQVELREVI